MRRAGATPCDIGRRPPILASDGRDRKTRPTPALLRLPCYRGVVAGAGVGRMVFFVCGALSPATASSGVCISRLKQVFEQ